MIDLYNDYWVYSKGTHPELKNSSYHISGQGNLGSINTNSDDFGPNEIGFGITADIFTGEKCEMRYFYFSMDESSKHYWGKYFYSEKQHSRNKKINILLHSS